MTDIKWQGQMQSELSNSHWHTERCFMIIKTHGGTVQWEQVLKFLLIRWLVPSQEKLLAFHPRFTTTFWSTQRENILGVKVINILFSFLFSNEGNWKTFKYIIKTNNMILLSFFSGRVAPRCLGSSGPSGHSHILTNDPVHLTVILGFIWQYLEHFAICRWCHWTIWFEQVCFLFVGSQQTESCWLVVIFYYLQKIKWTDRLY